MDGVWNYKVVTGNAQVLEKQLNEMREAHVHSEICSHVKDGVLSTVVMKCWSELPVETVEEIVEE